MGPDGVTLAGGVYVTPADGDKIIARPGDGRHGRGRHGRGRRLRPARRASSRSPGRRSSSTRRATSSASASAVFTRAGPRGAGALMDPGRWTVDQTLPSAEPGIRDPRLTAGPGGVLAELRPAAAARRPRARAPLRPGEEHLRRRRARSSRPPRSTAALDDVSSGQDAAGRLHVVWRTDLEQKLLRYTRSDPGGGTFAAPATLAEGETFVEPGGRGGTERRRLGRLAGRRRLADPRRSRWTTPRATAPPPPRRRRRAPSR